jgi:RHS repeat-associated protein
MVAALLTLSGLRAATNVTGSIAANTTWALAGSPYVVTGNVTVEPGVTLTVAPGVSVQFGRYTGLWIRGTLNAAGSAASPIVFTGTTEAADWWRAIFVDNAGSATLQWCRVRYAGYSDNGGLIKSGSGALTLQNSTLSNIDGEALRVYAGYSAFTSSGNTFSNSWWGVHLGVGASFDDQTSDFSGNGGDVLLDGGTISSPTVWGLKSSYSLYLDSTITVAAGTTLTLRPGTVLKFAQYDGLYVDGTLDARGTEVAPIHFTDWRDDSVGGDANHDGNASAPVPGWWWALHVRAAGAATLEWCHLAYAGYSSGYGIYKTGSGPLTLSRCTLSDVAGNGMNVTNSSGAVLLQGSTITGNSWSGLYLGSGALTASGCTFSNNADYGVYHEVNDTLVYADNTFTGNSDGCVGVGGGTMDRSLSWTLGAGDPFTLTVADNITVATGKTLTVSPGVTVRFARYRGLWIDGALSAVGQAASPITFTGTTETADWWRALFIQNAGSANLQWCRLRYAGYSDNGGLFKSGSGALTLQNSILSNIDGNGLIVYAGYSAFTSAGNTISTCWAGVNVRIGASFDDQTSDFSGNGVDVWLDGGSLDGPTVWGLKSGYSLYLDSTITVAAGATLTLRPGTILKFAQYDGLYVDGTLDARGTEAAPIHFSDWRDDSVGGDANHDGNASVPAPGWWWAIYVRGAGAATLEWCHLAYAGYSSWYGLYKTGPGPLTIKRSTLSDVAGNGMNVTNSSGAVLLQGSTITGNSWSGLYMSSAAVTATGCVFSSNADYGVYHEVNDTLAYADNIFAGNADGCVGVGGGTMDRSTSWTRGAGDPFTLTVADSITVAAGKTLTVSPGVTVRFARYRGLWIDGALSAVGTSASPITFTGTTETPDWWRALFVEAAGSANLQWCRLFFAGYSDNGGLIKSGSGALVLRNSTLSNIDGDGLKVYAGYSGFTSSDNTFANAWWGVRVGVDASFDDQTSDFSGNGGDVLLETGSITGATVWGLKSSYSLYHNGSGTVAAGGALTIRPGTVLKFSQYGSLFVDGTLDARGTPEAPINFTDWRDDSVGGDANHNGAADAPAPGWWRFLNVEAAGAAVLDYCRVAYAGYNDWIAVKKSGSGTLTVSHSVIRQNQGYGAYVIDSTGAAVLSASSFTQNTLSGLYIGTGVVTATGCTFSSNGEYGVLHEINDSIVYADNTFTGQPAGCVGVNGGTMTPDTTWTKGAGDPFTLTVRSNVTVAAGTTLTISPGVTIRFWQYRGIWVPGTLAAVGTSAEPITFTGTTETPGWWRYLCVQDAGAATLDFCRIANAGYNDYAGLLKTGAGALSVTNSTLTRTPGDGLRLAAGSSSFTSAGNLFSDCNYGVRLGVGASFVDNTSDFSGNNVNVYVDGGTIGDQTTWRLKPDYSVFLSGSLTVNAAGSLAIEAGTVVKFERYVHLTIAGALRAHGTPGAPIYFTDWRDDTVGGDANHDGDDSAPGPGWWRALFVQGAGSADLKWCHLAYAGQNDSVALHKSGTGPLSLENVTCRKTTGDGLRLDGSSGVHAVARCTFAENGIGVLVRNQAAGVELNGCLIQGNSDYGVRNLGTPVIDARNCWWGDASGPRHPSLNPAGLGNLVSDRVLFDPWLRNASFGLIIAPLLSGTIMEGDALRFLADPAAHAPGNAYDWDFGDGRKAPVLSPGLVTFPDVGAHPVSFTITTDGLPGASPDRRLITVVPAAAAPDLKISAFTVPADLTVGAPATLRYTVTNVGNAAVAARTAWSDAVYLSDDDLLDLRDVPLASTPVSRSLAVGESYSGTLRVRINAASEGPSHLILAVDDRWEVLDQHRLNGEKAAQTVFGVPVLFAGTAVNGQFGGVTDTSHLYRIDVTAGQNLSLAVSGNVRVYLRFGAFPTLSVYDRTVAFRDGGVLTVPAAYPGAWYIMLVRNNPSGDASYTIEPTLAALLVSSVVPSAAASPLGADLVLTLRGAGFAEGMTVELVSTAGSAYEARAVNVDTFASLSAAFDGGSVPPGVYAVRASTATGTALLPAAFEVLAGGRGPDFRVTVVNPERLGYHQLGTLYVEYANQGDTAMPAPVLMLTALQNGNRRALLTLDESRLSAGFWTAVVPDGFSHSVYFLAAGERPDVLLPGERGRTAVYYAGWQQPWDFSYPPFEFKAYAIHTTSTIPVTWDVYKEPSRPPEMDPAAWNIVWNTFTAQAGATYGSYVAMLNANAAHLARFGKHETDITRLIAFELLQAYGLHPMQVLAASVDARVRSGGQPLFLQRLYPQGIPQRHRMGAFGRGWTHSLDKTASVRGDGANGAAGTVVIASAGANHIFQPDSRGGYIAPPGYRAVLTGTGVNCSLTEYATGMTYAFTAGRLSGVTNGQGSSVVLLYDGAGRLTTLRNAYGQTVSLSYNAQGRIGAVADSEGNGCIYGYDASGEFLTTVTDPRGQITSYAYRPADGSAASRALTGITGPDTTTQYFTYDAFGRLASTRLGDTLDAYAFTYDANGSVTATNLQGGACRYIFDGTGAFAKAELPYAVYTSYTRDGQLSTALAGDGSGHALTHDAKGNLTAWVDPLGGTRSFAYDSRGGMTRFTDPNGRVTHFTRNGGGDLLTVTQANTQSESFSYDAQGNLTSRTNARGQTTTETLTTTGRLHELTVPGVSGPYQYTYAPNGDITAASGPDGITSITYNDAGRVEQISYPDGKSLEYEYDALGRRITMADHLGHVTRYIYDAAGRVQRLTDGAGARLVEFTYGPGNRPTRKDLGNGTWTAYAYDTQNRAASITNHAPDGAVLSRFTYEYDALGQIAAVETAQGRWTHTYDPLGRLTRAAFTPAETSAAAAADLAYRYDAFGNRLGATVDGATVPYTVNSVNQYTRVGPAAYVYDADGNLTSKQTGADEWTYAYDAANRLTAATHGAESWVYHYDAFGFRSSVIHNGVKTSYLYDPAGLGDLVGEFDANGSLLRRHVHLAGLAASFDAAGRAYYPTYDLLGNVSELTNGTGTPVNAYAYAPFGERLAAAETVPNPFQFGGEMGVVTDATGFVFMRNRYYSPQVGRFITLDPPRDAVDNRYTYAENAPTMMIDPLGTEAAFQHIPENVRRHLQDIIKYERQHGTAATIGNFNPTWTGTHNGHFYKTIVSTNCGEVDMDWFLTLAHFSSTGRNVGMAGGAVTAGPLGALAGWALTSPTLIYWPAKIGWSLIDWAQGKEHLNAIGNKQELVAIGMANMIHSGYSIESVFATYGITVGSQDPNQKLGPGGYGPEGWIADTSLFPYRIDFENFPTALAPAQVVTVTDQLDSRFDWSSFELTAVGFAEHLMPVPAHLSAFETSIAFEQAGKALELQVRIALNQSTGRVEALYATIDPETGLPPAVDYGFLPAEDGSGRGKGYFSYVIRPRLGLTTGTRLSNIADITFDFSTTIATNQIEPQNAAAGTDPAKECWLTLDADPPSSAVTALPALSPRQIAVTWTGNDIGSGVRAYTVYVQDNGGPFTAWMTTPATSATFSGLVGHTYGFYCVATDNVGSREAKAAVAETSTTVTTHRVTFAVADGGGGTLSGNRDQIVDHGTDASPVEAMPDFGHVFDTWSRVGGSATQTDPVLTLRTVTTAQTWKASFSTAGTVAPNGSFLALATADGGGAGRLLWDLTGTYTTTLAGHALTLNVTHDTRGNLTGVATCLVGATPVAMPIKGSVRGSGGNLVVSIAIKGTAADAAVAATYSLTAVLATPPRLEGTVSGSVKTGATTTPLAAVPVSLNVPGPMDGTWTLRFQPLAKSGRTIAGAALLTLSNGVELRFVVQGKALAGKVSLSLAGQPSDPWAKGLKIKITAETLEGGWARLEAISCRAYGQSLSW